MKPGEVYTRTAGEYTTTALITSKQPYRASIITIGANGYCSLDDKRLITKQYPGGMARTDWQAWAAAVGKLTDYLLAEPAEAIE